MELKLIPLSGENATVCDSCHRHAAKAKATWLEAQDFRLEKAAHVSDVRMSLAAEELLGHAPTTVVHAAMMLVGGVTVYGEQSIFKGGAAWTTSRGVIFFNLRGARRPVIGHVTAFHNYHPASSCIMGRQRRL